MSEHTDDSLGTAEVLIVEHPPGFVCGCKKCGKVIDRGNFALGLKIHERGHEFKYFLGVEPKPVCCGEEKTLVRVFQTAKEAEPLRECLLKHLDEFHTTKGLVLVAWTIPQNN